MPRGRKAKKTDDLLETMQEYFLQEPESLADEVQMVSEPVAVGPTKYALVVRFLYPVSSPQEPAQFICRKTFSLYDRQEKAFFNRKNFLVNGYEFYEDGLNILIPPSQIVSMTIQEVQGEAP